VFKYIFSNKKVLTRNTGTYPITLSEIKEKSFYFLDNPSDTSQDSYINNVLIPNTIKDWERSTKYLLLDQEIEAFIPNIQFINTSNLEMIVNNINVRSVEEIKYYPEDWDEIASKSILSTDDYLVTSEIKNSSKKIRLKKDKGSLVLFPITNNFEVRYKGGFEANDFNSLDETIKQALCVQVATQIDVKQGYCEDYYRDVIESAYAEYEIQQDYVCVI
jgi:hypothetical protein